MKQSRPKVLSCSETKRLRGWLYCSAIAITVLFGMVKVSVGADGQLAASQIHAALKERVSALVARDGTPIKAYFAASGKLAGFYKGKRFSGRWWTDDNLLCLDFPKTTDDGCWVVVHRHDLHFQLFTVVGEPVSNLDVEMGDANNLKMKERY